MINKNNTTSETREVELIFKKKTWGSYGQYTMTLDSFYDVKRGKFIPPWEADDYRLVDESTFSRKNQYYDKKYYIMLPIGTIIRRFTKYQSSGRKEVESEYYKVTKEGLEKLEIQEIKRKTGIYINIDGVEICVFSYQR